MKKLLTLLLGLWALSSFGQVVESPIQFKLDGATVTGKFMRDLALYPYVTGFAAAKAAAESRTSRPFNVTITSGSRKDQILLALTTPPPSTTMATGVTWLTGLRYSLVNNLLSIEAAGEAVTLKFGRQDGQSMTGTNPNGAVLNTTDFFPNGPLTGQGSYDKEWSAQFTPAVAGVPLVVTLKRASTGVIVAYNFTPVSGANRVQIIGGTTTSPPSSTTTAPPVVVAGEFNYDLPPAGSQEIWDETNNTPISSYANIAPGQVAVQENTSYRVEIRKGYGGAIQIFDKAQQRFNGQGYFGLFNFIDQGRESGMSTYSGPDNFSQGQTQSGIGWNPLQAGDSGNNPSVYMGSGRTASGYDYTKFKCLSWPHKTALQLEWTYEQWVKLVDNKVDVKVRLTSDRSDQTFYRPYQQEWPMMMINGARNLHAYNGSAPYTNAGTFVTDGKDNGGQADGNAMLTPFKITENWYATEINNSGKLIGVVLPEMYDVSYNVDGVGQNTSDEGSYTISYWSHHPLRHIDAKSTELKSYTYVIGTEAEIRAVAYAAPRRTVPDFHFTQGNGRCDWVIYDGGYDQRQPFTSNNWKVNFTGKADPGQPMSARGTKLISPAGSWKASDFTTVYVRLKYNGPETQLAMRYYKAGQSENGIPGTMPQSARNFRFPNGTYQYGTQTKTVQLSNNNGSAFQTLAFTFQGDGNFNGIIQRLELIHVDGGVIPAGETFEISDISANNPGN